MPKLSIPLMDFHLGDGRTIALVKVGSLGAMLHAPGLTNLGLSECFDLSENRLGGVISFPEDFPSASRSELMSHPFKLLNCVAVASGDESASISPVEWDGLAQVCVDRKIKTKKGKTVDPRELRATPGLFVMDGNSPTIQSTAEVHEDAGVRIGLVRFRGIYRPGSDGLGDAVLIGRVLNMVCARTDPAGMVVDLSELDYQYGDDLHVGTYKFRGARSPIVVIAKPEQVEAYRGAGINCIVDDRPAALALAVERSIEWAKDRG